MRIESLQRALQAKNMIGALIIHPRDLFYYAGTAQPCNLLIPSAGEPVLFVRRALDFVKRDTHIQNIESAEGFGPVAAKLSALYPRGGILGIEEDIIPVSLYRSIEKAFTGFGLGDISAAILKQRAVKEAAEIEAISKAADLFRAVHQTVQKTLRPGLMERELAADIYQAVRQMGGEFINYHRRWDGASHHEGLIAGSGTAWQISGLAMTVTGVGSGPAVPWGASDYRFRKGDLVVVDIGINRSGYHADVARTYAVGRAGDTEQERFAILQKIMEEVMQYIRPGEPAENLFLAGLVKAGELGVTDYFMGYGKMQGTYIGHGIGLEMDDPPVLMKGNKTPLQAGMVLCIEPKLIFPGWGAVDIEDTLVVTEGGPEILTPVPRELFEVCV